ncbi:copper resistance CopC family protein [Actinomycetospora sp.]|uniref:copper resistance CopC family protein n=1 Tax=Actinomycetospora sp. TaxID=1872135 RepID=UPI002F40586F
MTRPPAASTTLRRRPRRTTGLAVLAALVSVLLALAAGPAAAHDVIEGSDPADGASVAAAPSRITLTFGEAPAPDTATVTVVGPDGSSRWEQGTATTDGARVSVGVNPLGPAGRYQVGYRVVSGDGHPVSGALSFTLTMPGTGTANGAAPTAATPAAPVAGPTTAPATTPSPAAAAEPAPDGGLPAWPFVVLAVVVVLGALAMVLRRRS